MSEKTHADPTALGLFGLAIVTLAASTQKLGITSGLAYVIPWAIFLGGFAQLMAGMLDYKKGNVFGATAFCGYGLFWLGMATSWLINTGALGEILKQNVDINQMGFVFIGYLIFTIFLTIGSLSASKVLFFIFVFIDLLFIELAISTLVKTDTVHVFFAKMAGISELIISLLSFYACGANILYNHYGKEIIPIGKPFILKNQ